MAETLSQSQIDDLLQRMRSGQVEEKPREQENSVKEYDFSQPKKFTRDQIKSLRSLNENFTRELSSYFTSILRDVCEVSISQIEEQRYFEFNNALPETVLVGLVACTPAGEDFDQLPLLVEFTSAFGFYVLERLLGGSGKPKEMEREYTAVELAMLHSVLTRVTQYLGSAWNNFFEAVVELQSIETNGRMVQAFSPQDIVVIITMEIKTEDGSSTANLCIPANNLEEIINSIGLKYMYAERQQDGEKERHKQEALYNNLKGGNLEMVAYLDQFQMSLSQIVQLQPNDVIELSKRIGDNISVQVEGESWFKGRLGELDTKKALKVVGVAK